jgi:DNA-directed RNA polymerase specialized sigma24 family protein
MAIVQKVTAEQFEALCALLRLRRAGSTREALRMILVDGARVTDAARATGMSQPAVSNALARARRVADLARRVAS